MAFLPEHSAYLQSDAICRFSQSRDGHVARWPTWLASRLAPRKEPLELGQRWARHQHLACHQDLNAKDFAPV